MYINVPYVIQKKKKNSELYTASELAFNAQPIHLHTKYKVVDYKLWLISKQVICYKSRHINQLESMGI